MLNITVTKFVAMVWERLFFCTSMMMLPQCTKQSPQRNQLLSVVFRNLCGPDLTSTEHLWDDLDTLVSEWEQTLFPCSSI